MVQQAESARLLGSSNIPIIVVVPHPLVLYSATVSPESYSSSSGCSSSSLLASMGSGQKKKQCNVRHPKGSGSSFILVLNLLVFSYQQGAGYNLVTLITDTKALETVDPWVSAFLSAMVIDFLPKLFYPVAGWLADAKYGRYKVIRGGLIIMWIAAVLLLITSIIKYLVSDVPSTDDNIVTIITIPAVVTIYIISAVGTACFHVNIIPFGIDQMEDGSSEQISSFLYWYYWTRNMNFGILVQFAISSTPYYCKASSHGKDEYDLVISLLQVTFLACAFCLDRLWCKHLNVDPKIHNPIKKVFDVSKYIVKHDKPVGYRRAHTYTYDAPPIRSDFAKDTYGGKFSEDDVEDVVAFWRIITFLVAIGAGVVLTQSGTYSYPLYFDHINHSDKYLVTNLASIMTFTICIPVFEFFIYPLFCKYIPRMTRRIGLGMLVMLACYCSLFVVDFVAHQESLIKNSTNTCLFYRNADLQFSPFTVVPIIVLMSVGEMLTFIAVYEFICAQTPYSMRGLIIGMLFFIYGLFSGLVGLLMVIFAVAFKSGTASILSCGSSYSLGILAIGILGFFFYVFIARWYRKRQRGGQYNVNHQAVVEVYYEQKIRDGLEHIYLDQQM